MIETLAETLSGPSWGAMSAAERDQARAIAKRALERLLTVSRAMAMASLGVRRDPHMQFATDEARAIEEFKAVVTAILEGRA